MKLLFVLQARNIETGALAAVKIIKLEPGKSDLLIISAVCQGRNHTEKSGEWVCFSWDLDGKSKKSCCTVPALMTADISALRGLVLCVCVCVFSGLNSFWFVVCCSLSIILSKVSKPQHVETSYKKEDERTFQDWAWLQGLCWHWPSDRVGAIQISGITTRALDHQQPDRAQLITSQWRKRFAAAFIHGDAVRLGVLIWEVLRCSDQVLLVLSLSRNLRVIVHKTFCNLWMSLPVRARALI